MEIHEYFSEIGQEHWKNEISRAEWGAADFLIQLLNNDEERIRLLGRDSRLYRKR